MVMVDAWLDPIVAIMDVSGAFMKVNMDELVHIQLTSEMIELLLETDCELNEDCMVYEHSEIVLYINSLNSLYRTIRAD